MVAFAPIFREPEATKYYLDQQHGELIICQSSILKRKCKKYNLNDLQYLILTKIKLQPNIFGGSNKSQYDGLLKTKNHEYITIFRDYQEKNTKTFIKPFKNFLKLNIIELTFKQYNFYLLENNETTIAFYKRNSRNETYTIIDSESGYFIEQINNQFPKSDYFQKTPLLYINVKQFQEYPENFPLLTHLFNKNLSQQSPLYLPQQTLYKGKKCKYKAIDFYDYDPVIAIPYIDQVFSRLDFQYLGDMKRQNYFFYIPLNLLINLIRSPNIWRIYRHRGTEVLAIFKYTGYCLPKYKVSKAHLYGSISLLSLFAKGVELETSSQDLLWTARRKGRYAYSYPNALLSELWEYHQQQLQVLREDYGVPQLWDRDLGTIASFLDDTMQPSLVYRMKQFWRARKIFR
ncbi:hypothetical protein PN462_19085 [Spirulina sp. CS-785/01]|uniref:hypothetical protein n=1 Tax=Spirulina sp. CS-785/01 TaxID=3021716 RepID=UPI0023314775|nr:hypothetical protein [Spirulina sp. CS-785/01]MDB9315227.1 hypothetical protein [Spirulina sp. CS-785/01]